MRGGSGSCSTRLAGREKQQGRRTYTVEVAVGLQALNIIGSRGQGGEEEEDR
jgi:hypothetical protein